MMRNHPPQHARRVSRRHELTRRRALVVGALTAAAGGLGVLGYEAQELVRSAVDDVSGVRAPLGGLNINGGFYSRFRRTFVGWTLGYPTGHGPGDRLPLVVFLHGYTANHLTAMASYSPGSAASVRIGGRQIPPVAIVTVDGGNGYWHPHPGDDPMGMVLHELLPRMAARGLGVAPHGVAVGGISMGGYGAIAFAEHYPTRFRAVAAISPAIFATYDWVHYVNPGAYWSAADFARYDAITHARALGRLPVRVASGAQDPFHPWVEEFVAELPPSDVVTFPPGAHTGSFFDNQIPPSIAFLAHHLHGAADAE